MIRTAAHYRPRPSSASGLLTRLAHAHDTWRQRRALERLDARALDDIGLTHDDVRRESRRSLWDAPQGWKM